MRLAIFMVVAAFAGLAYAQEPTPGLPPAGLVAQALRASPAVQAAAGQVSVEEAQGRRLEAGSYEWNLRIGGQQRRTYPANGPDQTFGEWNAAIERPVRLPGKAALDAELGAAGVSVARVAYGDAVHEAQRNLLRAWFTWLKEERSAALLAEQVDLLGRQADAVRRRQQLGDAARLEAIQAEAARAQAEAALAQARLREGAAAEALRRRFPGLPLVVPEAIAEPSPIAGDDGVWIETILAHSHELARARRETERARLAAGRLDLERRPDPTFGVHVASERGGEEHLIGAYVSIPLPGGARRAAADAAQGEAEVAHRREAAALQQVSAGAATLVRSARAAQVASQAGDAAAERLSRAANMSARAYQLGEGSLDALLTARRLANEARLNVSLLQLDALELRYRLLLDAHRLWDADDDAANDPDGGLRSGAGPGVQWRGADLQSRPEWRLQ